MAEGLGAVVESSLVPQQCQVKGHSGAACGSFLLYSLMLASGLRHSHGAFAKESHAHGIDQASFLGSVSQP